MSWADKWAREDEKQYMKRKPRCVQLIKQSFTDYLCERYPAHAAQLRKQVKPRTLYPTGVRGIEEFDQ